MSVAASTTGAAAAPIRHDWTVEEITAICETPLLDLLARAHGVHRAWHDVSDMQRASLLSIKTGACPEDCAYCPQSAHFETPVKAEKLMETAPVIEAARKAKAEGASRFCMGAAWRSPKERDMPKLEAMIRDAEARKTGDCDE